MKILIVEDELIVAENIATILENAGYEVSGMADNADEAIKLVKEHSPTLLICDIYIKGSLNGIELNKELKSVSNFPVIYLTAYGDKKTIESASETEPIAYLVKPFTEKQLLATVNMVMLTLKDQPEKLPPPTKRETEIVTMLAKGYGSKKIAEELFLSELTVQTHRRNLMQKYNTNSSNELVALAIKQGWIRS